MSRFRCEPYLLDVLLALRDIVTEGEVARPTWEFDDELGICKFVEDHVDRLAREAGDIDYQYSSDHDRVMRRMFEKWPDFSGNSSFPVPINRIDAGEELWADLEERVETYEGVDEHSELFPAVMAEEAFYEGGHTLWEGGYGQCRIELLDFCIDYLEENGFEF